MSPISSRNSVPPSASSNFPIRWLAAPVKAPRSWPNSSDSISSFGIAAQFTSTKGFAFLLLSRWIAFATSSFPEPFSPEMRTRTSVGATRSTIESTSRIFGLQPRITSFPSTASRIRWYSVSNRCCSAAFRTAMTSLSLSSGLGRKSYAPRRVASTAVSIVPCPEIMITGRSGRSCLILRRTFRPSSPGILISRRTASTA